jgi:predicted HicB family RNase H-like nuclease
MCGILKLERGKRTMEKPRLTIEIDKELKQEAKVKAVTAGYTLKEWIIRLITKELER